MKLLTLGGGFDINLDNVLDITLAGNVITFTRVDSSTVPYTSSQPTVVLAQIRQFAKSSDNSLIINDVAPPSNIIWSAITPNTITVGQFMSGVPITGSGFVTGGVNGIKFDDGSQTIIAEPGFGPPDDNQLNISTTDGFLNSDVYTVFYTQNNGATWFTTGLTVTAS